MIVYGNSNKIMVLYIANGFKTIIAVFRVPTAGQNMIIQNVVRFDQFGAFTTGVSSTGTPSTPATTNAPATVASSNNAVASSNNGGTRGGNINDMWNNNDFLMKFFNYYYNSDGTNLGSGFSSDYMLKTQIVPPVCPMCPMCPSTKGVCTNCGGNGGSGTGGNVASSNASVPASPGGGVGDLLRDTGSGATNLVRDAAGGATNLARDAASGTVDLAKDTVGGAVDLAKDTVGGTVDLAKETVGGTVDLAKDAIGGVSGLFARNPTQVGSITTSGGYGSSGAATGGVVGANGRMIPATAGNDPYSYYGALPSKSNGNFIPITADFSAFGR
jgi:hypothetical protein